MNMSAIKFLALALVAAGVLGLAYGSFGYTKESHQANLGPISLTVEDKKTSTSLSGPAWQRFWLAADCCSSELRGASSERTHNERGAYAVP
jgi:hypothetical protein